MLFRIKIMSAALVLAAIAAAPQGAPAQPASAAAAPGAVPQTNPADADTFLRIGRPQGPQGDSRASIDMLPDWSGGWGAQNPQAGGAASFRAPIPFKPAQAARFAELGRLAAAGGDVTARSQNCLPTGLPSGLGGGEAYLEFLFTPGRVTLTTEASIVRRIYTDGRKLPDDPDETFQGFSVGHWDNGILVVQTAGLDPSNEITIGIAGGKGMRVTEHMALKGADFLEIDTAIEAPEALTRPYATAKLYARHRNYVMHEFDCAQNNRDIDASGNQHFDLTPPPDLK